MTGSERPRAARQLDGPTHTDESAVEQQTPEAVSRDAPVSGDGASVTVPLLLLGGTAAGWWWSIRMADDMASMEMGGGRGAMSSTVPMSMTAFVIGWVAMMAAMMFPALTPMVKMYARAAKTRAIAPVPFFLAGYLVVWTAVGIPAYYAWRKLAGPLDDGAAWAGRLAGFVFVLAAVYQITSLKDICLRQCRSPISFFIRHGGSSIGRPSRATRLGAQHGVFCLGCCWAIMAILVALGTMHLIWMAALTAVIHVEKVTRHGERWALVAGAGFAVLGAWLVVDPSSISIIT